MPPKKSISTEILQRIEQDLQWQKKSRVMRRWAKELGISQPTLYRQFERKQKSHYSEQVPDDWLKKIGSFKLLSLDKKGCCLSTADAIAELQRKGELPQDFPFHRSSIDRLLRKYRYDIQSLTQSAPAVHLVTYWPNQVHEIDATVAPTYYLTNFGRVVWDPFVQCRHTRRGMEYKLILYSGWDHYSGCLYAKYYIAPAENSADLFRFLYEFWSKKKDTALPFCGFPLQYAYTDQGGIWKSKSMSALFERLHKICGFTHLKHLPGEPRATGGVESNFNTLKRFEKKLRIRITTQKPDVEKLNEWLYDFLVDLNNSPQWGRGKQSRNQLWLDKIQTKFLKVPPPFIDFIKMAYVKGETRQINIFCEIPWYGKIYHLTGLNNEIGREVQVWYGFNEAAIYVELWTGQIYGPFYPGRNEVPFGTYRRPALTQYEKTKKELRDVGTHLLGITEDYGYESPVYVRSDNIHQSTPSGRKIESEGDVADAQSPLQQEFTPDQAMLYIAMICRIYWHDAPPELRDFIAAHLEDIYIKQGELSRDYLDSLCDKLTPVLEEHGLIRQNDGQYK